MERDFNEKYPSQAKKYSYCDIAEDWCEYYRDFNCTAENENACIWIRKTSKRYIDDWRCK